MKLKLLFLLLLACEITQAETPVVQWAKSFGGDYFDEPMGVVLDSKGNSYVSGFFYSSSITIGTYIFKNENYTGGELFIVKYDQTGNIVWAKSITGNNSINSMAIDHFDNIYVCGYFRNDSLIFGRNKLYNDAAYNNTTPFIAKYDSNGNEIWAKACTNTNKQTEFEGEIYSICVDKDNNIHILGTFKGSMSVDKFTLTDSNIYYPTLFLAKFDSSGQTLWAKDGQSNGSGWCNPTSIAVDLIGNTFITGYYNVISLQIGSTILINSSYGDNFNEIFIAKYDQSGNPIWAKSPSGNGSDYASTLSVDKSGNAYIGGYFGYNQGFQKTELCPIKFDSISLSPSSMNNNLFLAKYNSNGKILWAKTVPSISNPNSNTAINSIFTDNKNNVYTTGVYNYNITFDSISLSNNHGNASDIFVNKSDSLGKIIWAKTYGGNLDDSGLAITGDNKGNLFLAGGMYSNNLLLGKDSLSSIGDLDVFVAKILLDTTHIYSTIKLCPGDSVVTLTAPSNNSNYSWHDTNNKIIGYTQSLIVKVLSDSVVYVCTFKNQQDSTITYSCTIIKYNPKADFSFSLSDCKTNTVQFTNKSASNLGSLTYLWNFGDGTGSTEISPLHNYASAGNHQVGLLIQNTSSGCMDSIQKTIAFYPKPIIKIAGDSTICHGVPVILKATGASTYQWSNGSTADSVQTAIPQNVWVIGYSASGCSSDTVYKKTTDITPLVSITGTNTYCPGYSTILKAHGATRYEWSNGSKADSIQVNSDTTVWVLGYSASCISDTIKYKVSQEPDISMQMDGNMYICTGGSTTLKVSGADSYSWSTGNKTNSVTINKAGDYSVTGSNKRGCDKTISFKIVEYELPAVDFSVTPTTVDTRHNTVNCTIPTQSGVDYTWDMGDGNSESGAEIQHSYTVSNSLTNYKISLTATNLSGCINTAAKNIEILLFIPNVFSPNGDGVNDLFMPGINLEIIDRNGMSLYRGNGGWDGNYHNSKMPDDTYYYVVTYKDNKEKTQIQKGFIILKR